MANTWYKSAKRWNKPIDKSLSSGMTAVAHEIINSSFFITDSAISIKYGKESFDCEVKTENDRGTRKGSTLYRLFFNKRLMQALLKDYPMIGEVEAHNPIYEYQYSFEKLKDNEYILRIITDGLTKSDLEALKKNIYSDEDDPKVQQKIFKEYYSRNPTWQKFFKNKLKKIWNGKCALTQIDNIKLLIAAHIKPFSQCTPIEAFDKYNGLLLCPNIDLVFELGLISFDDLGNILISSKLEEDNIKKMQIDRALKINLRQESLKYITWHRNKWGFE